MTTYSDLIEETRHHLMTSQPNRINVLNASIDDTVELLVLRHANKGVDEGSILVIGLEEMYTLSATTTGETTQVAVIRGVNGSVKAAHTASDLIYVNPQFSSFWISKQLNHALDTISSEGLFQMRTTVFNNNASILSYDLAGLIDYIDVWRVSFDSPSIDNIWTVLRSDEYYVDAACNITDFPSGKAIFIRQSVPTAGMVQVAYKSGFTHLVNLADDVETVSGLHKEAHDLPVLYAAICLLTGREIKRTFLHNQPEPRRQEEVPPGSSNQAMRPTVEQYYTRVDKEIQRLKRKYPNRL